MRDALARFRKIRNVAGFIFTVKGIFTSRFGMGGLPILGFWAGLLMVVFHWLVDPCGVRGKGYLCQNLVAFLHLIFRRSL